MQRKPHQDHFNAKTSGSVRMGKKGFESMKNVTIKKAIISRYTPN